MKCFLKNQNMKNNFISYFFLSFFIYSITISADYQLLPYDNLDFVLSSFVDDSGQVDYSGIMKNPYNINQFLDFI